MNTSTAFPRTVAPALLLLIASMGAQSALAAETGFYVGGFYGEASRDGKTTFFDEYTQAIYDSFSFTDFETTARQDTKDSAFGFQVGYRLTQHWAVEGGYMDLGQLTYRAVSPGTFPENDPATLNLNLDSEISGIALTGLGVLPLTRSIELYARGGVVFTTSKLDVFITDGVGSRRGEFSETATDLLAGVGASMAFLEIYGLRLEFQRIFAAGEEEAGGGQDIDLISLGITVAF